MNKHASLNRIYRLVWNEALNAYVPAAETARGRGKRSCRSLVATVLALSATVAQAGPGGPAGGVVTGGNGTITQSGSTTTITQSSQNLFVNWQSFNVAPQDTVDFVQPNASAIAVNRILSASASSILGHLNANGQVYLINPNGVIFGEGSEVDVGGLVASTLNLDPATAGSGTKSFGGTGTGSVINEGAITAANGGSVALLGNHVANTGVISAQLGTVALGAGSAATLTFAGSSLVKLQVDASVLKSEASNGGLIRADGGTVLMTAGAKNSLLASVVNNTGVIEARTVENHEGTITLLGGMTDGTVHVAGTLDASAPNGGHGGSVETSGAHVEIADGAKVTTAAALGLNGTWLIDPTDFTIAPSGGDETGAGLSSALGSGNVQIQSSSGSTGTSGNINVNDTVTWSANTLTLTAYNNININSTMNGSGTASLVLQYGQGAVNAGNTSVYNVNAPVNLPAGQNFTTKLGSDGTPVQYTVITSLGQSGDATTAPGTATLQGMAASANLGGSFVLGADIDASATSAWNSNEGFTPIGAINTAAFTGRFDGLDHTVSNLTIDRTSTNNVGLFGYTQPGATIQNLTISGGSVAGAYYSGLVVGYSRGSLSTITVTGTVSATGGTDKGAGGIAGVNYGSLQGGTANVTVNGRDDVGGLVGLNWGSISGSSASGNVSGSNHYTGGLVGDNLGAVIDSHATGNISGLKGVGGLTGSTYGSIANSYATGTVTGTGTDIGGLTGILDARSIGSTLVPGSISNSYSTGNVTGPAEVGGLVGLIEVNSNATLSNSFYDVGAVLINGAHQLTAGGIYHAQYVDWFTHGEVLSIANYSATLPTGAGGFYDVSSVQGFEDMLGFVESNVAANFRLTANISLPQGVYAPYFAGSFDGGGLTISNVSVVFPNSNLGLFGYLPSASKSIANLAVSNGTVTGNDYVGGLVGDAELGVSINASSFSGTVSGGQSVGGLQGYSSSPTNSISNSYFSGSLTATTVYEYDGGLIGINYGSVTKSFATGSVNSAGYGGGLVGENHAGGHVSNSYFSGSVNAGGYAGGVAGANYGAIDKTYAKGPVTSSNMAGGLVGSSFGTITNSFYDKSSNPTLTGLANYNGPIADVAGQATGLTATQMMTQSYFTSAGWDFTSPTWIMYAGQTTPLLRSFLTPLTVTAASVSRNYDATANGNEGGVTYITSGGDGQVLGTATYGGSSQGAVQEGSYVITPGGLYSDQLGYLINYANGALTVNPAPLTVSSTTVAGRTYNGTTVATLSGGTLTGLIGGDSVTLNQSGIFASKNPGTGIAVTATDTLSGASASDYTLVEPTGLTGTITPEPVTVSGTSVATKVFDGTTVATLTGGTLSGVINSTSIPGAFIPADSVTLNQSGSFATKNAGTGIAVTATDTLSGANASDYTIVEPTGLTGTITPASLTVSGSAVADRAYNGTTAATLVNGTLNGLVSGYSATLVQSGNYATKNAGTGIAVTANDTLSGANASDYTLVEPTGLTGTITPASLSVTGTEVAPKVANGTTSATLIDGTLVGVVSGDSVSLLQSGVFASANAGSNIPVTATDTLSGASASNYSLVEPAGLTGTISPASASAVGTAPPTPVVTATPPPVVAAQSQVESSFVAPQLGAVPQTINASPTITVLASAAEPTATAATSDVVDATGGSSATGAYSATGASNATDGSAALSDEPTTRTEHKATTVNVAMKIGAVGTLHIENGGLRLPGNLTVGNE